MQRNRWTKGQRRKRANRQNTEKSCGTATSAKHGKKTESSCLCSCTKWLRVITTWRTDRISNETDRQTDRSANGVCCRGESKYTVTAWLKNRTSEWWQLMISAMQCLSNCYPRSSTGDRYYDTARLLEKFWWPLFHVSFTILWSGVKQINKDKNALKNVDALSGQRYNTAVLLEDTKIGNKLQLNLKRKK